MSFSKKLSLRNVGFLGGLGGFKAEGGTVSFANINNTDYQIHTFVGSGTFSVLSGSAVVEYLIVAAGGSGGGGDNNNQRPGGGGGAGGLLLGTSPVVKNNYTVTVAGTSVITDPFGRTEGAASSVFGLTAVGGGAGAPGTFNSGPGSNGGSGGGGARGSSGGSGFAGPPRQGWNGGTIALPQAGSGGGAGGNASGTTRGPGLSINMNGQSLVYALGGQSGPPSGGNGSSGTNGRGNGGNGGGGNSGNNTVGGNGGSGIVIIRYPI